jgi:hypothetical protein
MAEPAPALLGVVSSTIGYPKFGKEDGPGARAFARVGKICA